MRYCIPDLVTLKSYILTADLALPSRPLIMYKMFAVNIFPIVLIALGIARIAEGRQNNYGCGEEEPKFYPDDGPIYGLFCVLIVTFALELLVFPAIVTNKIVHLIRASKLVRRTYSTRAKGERLEQCLGMVFKCIALCCRGQGGHDLKNKGEWKDFASNLVRFLRAVHHLTMFIYYVLCSF